MIGIGDKEWSAPSPASTTITAADGSQLKVIAGGTFLIRARPGCAWLRVPADVLAGWAKYAAVVSR